MWKKANVVFRLKSPLHIGYLPFKGSVVSPTRYYIPAKNLWGAITKRVTEYLDGNPSAEKYKSVGKEVMENFRFSYFYLFDGKTIYFPHYTEEGLKYDKITKSAFEHRFIGSLISTAIDDSGTAKDESLHEIEYINNKFKDENGNINDVKITGRIWIKKDTSINSKNVIVNSNGIFINNDFNIIQELILGGESKYGFGDVLLDPVTAVKLPIELVQGDGIKVKINKSVPLPSHLRYHKDIKFKGDIELLSGRGHFDPQKLKDNGNNIKMTDKPGETVSKPEYYLSPGTVLIEEITSEINWDGTLSR